MRTVLFLFALVAGCLRAEPAAVAPEAIVQQFCAASKEQEHAAAAASMDVDIQASLPKLKKQGRLHALRRISALGRITYDMLRFEGDGTVKTNVIARYLTAEAEARAKESPELAVTPDNYKFKYRGRVESDGHTSYIFQVTPRKKRVGLFRGDIWIDARTHLRVRESGYFVKNPSLFLKRIAFVRNYEIRDGVAVPRRVQSVVDTRLVGPAELEIEYSNYSLEPQRAGAAEADAQ